MRKEKGITLISLVVTIIVLIILAGVSINLILGQDGIITKAKEAKENMELATIEEQEQLNELYNQMGTQINSSPSIGNSGDESKINDFKIAIANYIAEAGGVKPEYTADTATFGEKIKGIVKEVTKDATATADDIVKGKTAWVNGQLITGNFVDSILGEDVKTITNSDTQYTDASSSKDVSISNEVTMEQSGIMIVIGQPWQYSNYGTKSFEVTKNGENIEAIAILPAGTRYKAEVYYAILKYEKGDVINVTTSVTNASTDTYKAVSHMIAYI